MNKKPIVLSIPTGIGADIGGYAGDFGYIARKFSRYFYTIVNPNAVNGGILSAINYDMGYLEGNLLDSFIFGEFGITPKKPYETNRIGVLFDCSIKKEILNIHLNTLNALRMVKGIDICAIEYTNSAAGVELTKQKGISQGSLSSPDAILDGASRLIKKGAQAIAVVCNFFDLGEDDNYSCANGVDPIGGVEAIISHLITSEFRIPAAHAPAFSTLDISYNLAHPKVASELISSTYLPCVIEGLSIAPLIKENENATIINKDIGFLIVPYSAMGSKAVLGAYENGIKIISVNNKTILNVNNEKLNINTYKNFDNYEQCLLYLINCSN